MAEKAKYLHLFVVRDYTNGKGEEKTSYIKVGAAFPNKAGGFGLEIEEGISVSGKFVALPPRENEYSKSGS